MAHLTAYTKPRQMAKEYIAEHQVQQMFSSLLSALIMHKPEDPINFIQTTLDEIKTRGPENVNWESFIYELHPYRNPTRLDIIKDDSEYQTEARRQVGERAEMEKYKPEVFKLTENSSPAPQ